MSTLFKVTSGKKAISIICVLQNFYCSGKYSREIRNSANYFCLFRNSCDQSINSRAARDLGLLSAWKSAEKELSQKQYPYAFCDVTSKGSISNYRLYTNILDPVRVVYSVSGMRGYVVPEKFFTKYFSIISETGRTVRAIEGYENQKKNIQESNKITNSKKRRRKRKTEDKELIQI